MSEPLNVINFTRGVPANESFPIDEVIDAARGALTTQGRGDAAVRAGAGFQPLREWLAEWQGVSVDRVLTGNGSLQLIEFLCLHLLKAGDVVFTEAPTYDRTIDLLRRHGAKVVGIPLEADGPDIAGARASARAAGAEVLLRHSGLPESVRRDLLGGQAPADRGARRPARVPDRRRCAVPPAALSRPGGADALRARARADAAHELVHQAHRARRPHRVHDWRAGAHRASSPRWRRTRTSHPATSRRASLRVVPAGAAAAADRAPEEAVRAAARRLPRGPRQVHARCRGDASRRRVLHLADACPRA